ncbi:hypothetical protein QAD02_005145 [Eretmocerus hayati]|uniref:Uncharacterized protein n=1 Tax=Eretmocerus hayati TaxID=131215 RepID=A0ACC2NRQ9_9HYME|nr:hypothetical protein QAD02_005145 [Eretmocerus hayati]
MGLQYSDTLLSELSSLSWESILRTGMLNKSIPIAEKFSSMRHIDNHFSTYFNGCLSDPNHPKQLQEMKDIMMDSSRISDSLDNIMSSINPAINDFDLVHATEQDVVKMIDYYSRYNPLNKIHDMVLSKSIEFQQMKPVKYSFVRKYWEFGSICLTDMSGMQQIATFFQLFRWMMTKLHTIVISVLDFFEKLGGPDDKTEVITQLSETYSIKNMVQISRATIKRFKEDWGYVSLAVYAQTFDKKIIGVTYAEIAIFKRMFLEQCRPSTISPTLVARDQSCAKQTSAPKSCPDLRPGEVCPVWTPCKEIICEDLHEPTTVCKMESNGIPQYAYHIPSHLKNEKPCDEFYWLFDGKHSGAGGICSPCKCICQKSDEPYYFSTDLITTDIERNEVITGAKFTLVDNTLVIVQQRGLLCQNGLICPNTTRWLGPTIYWKEKISVAEILEMDLTRVVLGRGEVITGLALRKVTDGSKNRLQLRASAHSYDYKSGKLLENEKSYYSKTGTFEVDRAQVIDADYKTSNVIVRGGKVNLTVSGDHDGGRFTLPFFDIRRVVTNPLSPLSGAGLYLRRQKGGSVIGIEVFTYDVRGEFFGQE